MHGSPKRLDADSAWVSQRATYQVMYLVKRPSYEFSLAIPEGCPLVRSADRAVFQMRFRDQHQPHGFVLNAEELEDFYEGLGRLVEYIKAERERRCRQR
jgi:hypothetical protein